jgi:hypothetical protein
MRFELTTLTLARLCSTPELRPRPLGECDLQTIPLHRKRENHTITVFFIAPHQTAGVTAYLPFRGMVRPCVKDNGDTMKVLMTTAKGARHDTANMLRLEDLRRLRALEGSLAPIDSPPAPRRPPNMIQRAAQVMVRLRLNRGSFGYP